MTIDDTPTILSTIRDSSVSRTYSPGDLTSYLGAIFLALGALVSLIMIRARREDVAAPTGDGTLTEMAEVI